MAPWRSAVSRAMQGSEGLRSAADVVAAAQLACLLEASVAKPGNVSPGRPFADTRYEDFLASASAIGPACAAAASQPLGLGIRAAVEATARWSFSNTNLGTVLLVLPLVRAALLQLESARGTSPGLTASDLRSRLGRVLEATTVDDARHVYEAIRRASPGGLGVVDEQDVADEPSVTLLEAMRLAADRDSVASEYVTRFATTFERGVPALDAALASGLEWPDAVLDLFLTLLADRPDSHIARRAGPERAAAVRTAAGVVLAAGGVRTDAGRAALAALDADLRDAGHLGNPGTTADLTAAATLVKLLCGGWHARRA